MVSKIGGGSGGEEVKHSNNRILGPLVEIGSEMENWKFQ